jgi:hypothetical protein
VSVRLWPEGEVGRAWESELKRALTLNPKFDGADDARKRLAQVNGT